MTRRPDLTVADLMSLEPIVVRASDRVEDAEAILRDVRISGLPVVDEDDVLVGVFSQTDVLHLRRPAIADLIRGRTGLTVGEVMSHPPITIDSMSSVQDAAQLMIEHDVHRLVATNRDGHAVGVLSTMDFVRMVAET